MNASKIVFEASPQNFQADVIEQSKQVPVLVLFWAQQVGPSAQVREMLERLVNQYQGKVLLALVDVARDQMLAQHLRVRGLPSLQIIRDGQLIEQIEGPQPETVFRQLLDHLTMSSADVLRAQLGELLAERDFDTAQRLLEQALREEPKNAGFRIELADLLVQMGALERARAELALIPADTAGRERPQSRLEIVEEAAGYGDVAVLKSELDAAPDDLEKHYRLAVALAAAGDYEAALEHAMHILRRNRGFRDDIGRTTMIRIFNLLGKGSDLANAYRRRMFAFMH